MPSSKFDFDETVSLATAAAQAVPRKSRFIQFLESLTHFPMPTPPAAGPKHLTHWIRPRHYIDAQRHDPLVKENVFIDRMPDRAFPANFPESQATLPEPFWDGHPDEIASYWAAWNLAFRNIKRVTLETGFIKPYIDTAFNDCLFLWDSVFILMFARYGERAFSFQRTLDNFYTKQHPSGFIARQIREWSGEDSFHQADPDSTGPNILPWSEWEYFLQFGDRKRLAEVFPVLLAYHRWMRRNRSWPDGTYWSTGWACGMDNQPRLSPGADHAHEHDHLSWLDATAQAVFSATTLVRIAAALDRSMDVVDLPPEIERLTRFINDHMWSEKQRFYVDRRSDGSLSAVKSIGAYWTLLAGIATPNRHNDLVAHLSNPTTFGRPHPIPSLSADDSAYAGNTGGNYWCGGIWPSANYMVFRGLTAYGDDAIAHQLARKHLDFATEVFRKTQTFWENYSPESAEPGQPARRDFVGWSGLGPIAVLLEYVLGLRPDFITCTLLWDIRLTEKHGVKNYPFGPDTTLNLSVATRASENEKPRVVITTNKPIRVKILWVGGSEVFDCTPCSS